MSVEDYIDYLGNLPSQWKKVELQELGAIYSGGTPSRENPTFWQGDIPWVTPGELTDWNGKYITTTRDRITEAGLAGSGARLLPENTLLVTTRATIGSVVLAGMEITTNQGFKSLVLGNDANPDFYYHLLRIITPEFIRRASGSTFLEISGSQFARVVVPFPPLPEQRRIAEILDAADEAIHAAERLIAKLRRVKAGLLHDLLTCGVDAQGNLRDPAAHPEQFKDSPLGKIPREWEVNTVAELGIWKGGSTPSKADPANWHGGNVVWLSPKDIQDPIIRDSEDKITEQAVKSNTLTLFDVGCIIVVFRSGILRHTFPVARVEVPFTVNQDMKVLNPGKGVDTQFAFWILQGLSKTVLSLAVKSGTTVESIDPFTFFSLLIPLPSIDEQSRIVAVFDAHDARIRAEEATLAKLRRIKAGLMDDLLTGRVRV